MTLTELPIVVVENNTAGNNAYKSCRQNLIINY
jgi:hypothetical protein